MKVVCRTNPANHLTIIYQRDTLSWDYGVTECGLFINTQCPFIGTSPDEIIKCTCHGKGILEIKCPFCHWEASLQTVASEDKKFCLKEFNSILHLCRWRSCILLSGTNTTVFLQGRLCWFLSLKDFQGMYNSDGIHIECI